MTTPPLAPPGAWHDEFTRATLQLLADGITRLVGFGAAAIRLIGDDGLLHTAVVSGSEEARAELEGTATPVQRFYDELAKADDWGLFKFVPHERIDASVYTWGWVPDIAPSEAADGWHPLDLLIAPFYDERGALCATLSVDLPDNGLRPDAQQREVLEGYAELTGRAIVTAIERGRLQRRAQLAEATRAVIRSASRELSLEALLSRIGDDLLGCFGLTALWARVFEGTPGSPGGAVFASAGDEVQRRPLMGVIAERQARRLWADRQMGVAYADDLTNLPDDADNQDVRAWAAAHGLGSVALVPLGAGEECLGALTLVRAAGAPRWTTAEMSAATDIGRDLGQLMLNARAFEREQDTVRELRTVDSYKSQLIAMVSHELKNPLTALLGNLEIVEEAGRSDDPVLTRALRNVDRAAQRMVRIVEDLLLLSRVGDPSTPFRSQVVDLVPLVREVCELTEAAAAQRDVAIQVKASPWEPMRVLGDPTELDRVVVNLVSNALKYTPEGRAIQIGLHRIGDDIELVVADQGIGISEEDQAQLFTEFFRSSDPQVLAQPGTGLGLAIVDRIVRRHAGRIDVRSELGRGSTFRVLFPAARPDPA